MGEERVAAHVGRVGSRLDGILHGFKAKPITIKRARLSKKSPCPASGRKRRPFAQSLSGSSLRTQGPITPGLKSDKRPLLQCRNESPRRRDERNCAHAGVPAFAGTTHCKSICDSPAGYGGRHCED